MIFFCVLLCKMEGCFARISARKYCLRLSNCSMIHNKAGAKMSHVESTCFKIYGHAGQTFFEILHSLHVWKQTT